MKIQFIAISLIALFFTSCDKDSSETQVMLTVQQKNVVATNVTLSQAKIGITEVDFELNIGDNEVDFEYEGDYAFDILTGKSTPEMNMVSLDAGMYHELEFYIAPVLASGNTIELVGTFGDYSFEFASKMEEDFEIKNVAGVSAAEGQENVFGLFLDFELLLEGINFANATVDADGVIRINNDSNEDMMDAIESNLEIIMEFDD